MSFALKLQKLGLERLKPGEIVLDEQLCDLFLARTVEAHIAETIERSFLIKLVEGLHHHRMLADGHRQRAVYASRRHHDLAALPGGQHDRHDRLRLHPVEDDD